MITLELNRPYARMFRWLNKATMRDGARPSLSGILIKMPYMWACDGIRMHRVNINETHFTFNDGFYMIKGIVDSFVIADTDETYFKNYPDMQKVWDNYKKGFAVPEDVKVAKYDMAINPRLLSEALSLPSQGYTAKCVFTDQAVYTSIVFDLGNGEDALAEALVLKVSNPDNGLHSST